MNWRWARLLVRLDQIFRTPWARKPGRIRNAHGLFTGYEDFPGY